MSLEILPANAERRYILVRLAGRLDAHTAEEYKPQLTALVGERAQLVGDLSGMAYISSAGLNLLIFVCRELRKKGGDFRLAGVQSYVKEIMDLTGYTKAFKLYDTVEHAAAGIA